MVAAADARFGFGDIEALPQHCGRERDRDQCQCKPIERETCRDRTGRLAEQHAKPVFLLRDRPLQRRDELCRGLIRGLCLHDLKRGRIAGIDAVTGQPKVECCSAIRHRRGPDEDGLGRSHKPGQA